MTTTIIISICVLILIAYAFDLTSKHTKIPTVILLLILGWLVKQGVGFFNLSMPNLEPLLLLFGTIGLILIVLEGSLGLELNIQKKKVLYKSALSATISLIILFLGIGFTFSYLSGAGVMVSILNAIPLCVISSAIAIPSVQNLSEDKKEFVVYESSFSDIIGVILFNYFLTNELITVQSFSVFFGEIAIMLVISLVSSIGLSFLIKKIDHHVKFIPILMMIILIYTISKIYHLPSLIFILIFGLFLGNLDELKSFSLIKRLDPEKLDQEVGRFREIVIEITFLVRTMFFLVFGYLINIDTLLDTKSLMIASGIVAGMLLIRFLQLKFSKIEVFPLMFIAPRGLITILLFLSLPLSKKISLVSESLILQVVLISIIVMMVGLMAVKSKKNTE